MKILLNIVCLGFVYIKNDNVLRDYMIIWNNIVCRQIHLVGETDEWELKEVYWEELESLYYLENCYWSEDLSKGQ